MILIKEVLNQNSEMQSMSGKLKLTSNDQKLQQGNLTKHPNYSLPLS
ncbi:MAG: hypothetical protein IPQ05_03855 [Leptospiraceae bacterium]|nr:hypothetical protein [Leptospiraceae bacterium]